MVQQVDIFDIFNYVRTFAVDEMAKAQKIMHSPYSGQEQDIAKVAAQGAHTVACALYDAMTTKIHDATQGTFSFKEETQNLIKNITEIDPSLASKVQLVQAPPAGTATPVEGEVIAPDAASASA